MIWVERTITCCRIVCPIPVCLVPLDQGDPGPVRGVSRELSSPSPLLPLSRGALRCPPTPVSTILLSFILISTSLCSPGIRPGGRASSEEALSVGAPAVPRRAPLAQDSCLPGSWGGQRNSSPVPSAFHSKQTTNCILNIEGLFCNLEILVRTLPDTLKIRDVHSQQMP